MSYNYTWAKARTIKTKNEYFKIVLNTQENPVRTPPYKMSCITLSTRRDAAFPGPKLSGSFQEDGGDQTDGGN